MPQHLLALVDERLEVAELLLDVLLHEHAAADHLLVATPRPKVKDNVVHLLGEGRALLEGMLKRHFPTLQLL